MKRSEQLFLSYQLIKRAATAPQGLAGGVGGTGMKAPGIATSLPQMGSAPLSSQWNNWESSMAKDPLSAASANLPSASGGLQAAAAAKAGQPVSMAINGFKKMMSGWNRQAHY